MDDGEILDLFERVREGWTTRDALIEDSRKLRNNLWKPYVPEAWEQTTTIQYTSLAREIPQRVPSTLIMREPVFSRFAPAEDWDAAEKALNVERFFQGKFGYDRRTALKGRDAYLVQTDSLVNKGAVCVGSIYAPNAWAGAPLFMGEEGVPELRWWRDSSGRETDNARSMDLEASSRAYMRGVDSYRQRAGCVVRRRLVPTEQAYPLIIENEMLALFIYRQSTMMELGSRGFMLDTGDEWGQQGRGMDFLEVITKQRIRFYANRQPVKIARTVGMTQPESDGTLFHGAGFVPYVYRVGMDSGEAEWGHWGMPLLNLIESNLKSITTLRTWLINAVMLGSFTSFYLEYLDKGNGTGMANVVDAANGRKMHTFEFKSGTIMDFGPDRKVNPFEHKGLNNDFYRLLEAERDEVDRIIPRAMVGLGGTSGFDTQQKTANARSLLESLQVAQELVEADLAELDMRHIQRHPGPVYVGVERRGNAGKKVLDRVRIDASDLEDYYEISVGIDRTMDYVTEGTWAAGLLQQGIGDKEWAAAKAGITDYPDMIKRQARDRFLDSEPMEKIRQQEAIRVYGLETAQERAAAMAQITTGPDGSALVMTPQGPAAPGLPSAQGPAGAAEAVSNIGQPNLASTNNPSIQLPGPKGTPRSRRRGGAIPGAPQRQPFRPPATSAAA